MLLMLIENGKLIRTRVVRGLLIGVEFQVRALDGAPLKGNYFGAGQDHGTQLVVGRDSGDCLGEEYTVDAEPTPESMERWHGFWCRADQMRGVLPKGRSEAFVEGWQDADRQIREETQEARAERFAAIRWDRAA